MLKFRVVNLFFLLTFLLALVYNLTIMHLSFIVFAALVLCYLGIISYGSSVLSLQFFLPVKFKGKENSNSIALTFDDGPVSGCTEKIIDILKSHKVSAAFFCVGHRIAENPALTRQIHEAGHLVGNHSFWHGYGFDLQSANTISRELKETDETIQKTIGLWPNFFRPPYGVTNPMVAKAVKAGGYQTIGWTLRSFDLRIKEPTALFRRVTRQLKPGDVILFHDRSQVTIEILPALLEHISKVGFKIVRLDELLNLKAYD